MQRTSRRLIFFPLLLLVFISVTARAQEKLSRLEFVVVHSANGKPVRNASVVLHALSKQGKQSKSGMELKTDQDGKALAPAVPYGKLRVQAIAPGMQTYGDDLDINQPEQQITIKMNRPQQQYSIYK